LSQAIVTRRAPRRRIFGRARVAATPVRVGPDQAGGNKLRLPFGVLDQTPFASAQITRSPAA
jgi:hypothetical protein